MTRRIVAGTAVGAGLIVTLAACGSTGSGKAADAGPGGTTLTANEVLLRTSQQTAQVSSFSADITLDSTENGSKTSTEAAGQVRLTPDVALTGTLNKASLGGFTLNSAVPVVLLNNTLYAKVPAQLSMFASSVTGGKPWVKVDLNQAGQQAGVDAAGTVRQIADLVSPANLTKTFTASKDAAKVGDQAINGVNTTHYHGTMTVKAALGELDASTQNKLKSFYDRAGNQNITFDLWADGQGLARKVTVSTGKGAITVVYSSFNKPVSVTAPPASQVGAIHLP